VEIEASKSRKQWQQKLQNHSNSCTLNHKHLNNQWVIEETRKEIKKS
jgi:hypothetical protein